MIKAGIFTIVRHSRPFFEGEGLYWTRAAGGGKPMVHILLHSADFFLRMLLSAEFACFPVVLPGRMRVGA
jgi:hypothetical protein